MGKRMGLRGKKDAGHLCKERDPGAAVRREEVAPGSVEKIRAELYVAG